MYTHAKWHYILFILVLVSSGCASDSNGGLTEREVGGLTGAGIGAGTGAIIGSATGHAAAGTAIGAPVGLLAGALVGEGMRRNKEDAREVAREEVQRANGYAPPVTSSAAAEENYVKYNPRTGKRFPASYELDPVTGEKLEYVK